MRLLPNLLLLWACLASHALAQAPSGPYAISGNVSDPSGAAIPDADIQVRPRGAASATAKARTDTLGDFRVAGLPAGAFEIDVRRDGFAPQTIRLSIKDRPPAPLHVALKLAGVRQEVTVSDSAGQVSTDSTDNLDVVTMDRQMMDNLPVFDQDYIATMSQFLDPGSIGTGGVTLVVNGMEQSTVGVSASAIQQVKINQNPYSAEFSRPGRGRIEVITKPASQVYHGTFDFLFRDYHLNARDPFAAVRPPEQRRIYEGSLLGPVGHSKKNSFLITVNREEQDLQAVVYALTPGGLLQQIASNPQRDTEISASITHQFTENHLATIRGNFNDSTEQNRGVGGFVLPEAGVNVQDREDEIYYNDSLVITPTLAESVPHRHRARPCAHYQREPGPRHRRPRRLHRRRRASRPAANREPSEPE